MVSPYYGMKILVAAASDRADTICTMTHTQTYIHIPGVEEANMHWSGKTKRWSEIL